MSKIEASLWYVDSTLKKKDRERILARHGEPPYFFLSLDACGMMWIQNGKGEQVMFDPRVLEPECLHVPC